MMGFTYRCAPNWPPLAWIACCEPGSRQIEVTHGPQVETHPNWFGEIVWAGDFAAADFDETDVVFGSGAVAHPGRATAAGTAGEVVFVSSGATVDRLQSLVAGGRTWISNSLACLLAQVDGRLDPTDRSWFDRLGTITRGIENYEPDLPTSAGPVRLTYFYNLAWNGRSFEKREKPLGISGFESFKTYRDYLAESLAALGRNAEDGRRQHPFALMGTISGGLDSPMVATLARSGADLTEAITFARDDGSDTGEEAAEKLGIHVTIFSRDDWKRTGVAPEAAFIAGDAKGEDVFLAGAEAMLAGRLLLTGHNVGILLDRNRPDPNRVIRRKDRSGTSVTEWRLHAGFVHCPVGFIGVRHAPDLTRISRQPEMDRWSLGGWYDKPVARRIVEEAGVPREAFGIKKRASSVLFFKSGAGLSRSTMAELGAWLRSRAGEFLRKGRIPPGHARPLLVAGRWASRIAGGGLMVLRKRLPAGRGGRVERLATRMIEHGQRDPTFDYAFPWAVERMKQRYPAVGAADRAAVGRAPGVPEPFAAGATLNHAPLEPVQT